MSWTNKQAYEVWKGTLKGDEGDCRAWLADPGNALHDPGGLTHWGVTRATWITYAHKHGWNTSVQGQCAMTDAQLGAISSAYWAGSGAAKIKHPGVAILAAAMYWGTGAIWPLQRALVKQGFAIQPDGVFGPATEAAANAANALQLIRDIHPDYTQTLIGSTHARYHVGLSNRVTRLYSLAVSAQQGAKNIVYEGKQIHVPRSSGKLVDVGWAMAGGLLITYIGWKAWEYWRGND